MKRILNTTRLQMNKPGSTFLVPLYILALVMVISIIIVLAIQRGGADPASADYISGARMNMGVVWSLPGFLVYLGVQAVATTFPLALTVLLLAPQLGDILTGLTGTSVAIFGVVVAILAMLGTWVSIRRRSVR